MSIAFILNENEKIVPITDGTILRILDEQTDDYTDYPNPALNVEKGKRSATLAFALEKGAKAIAALPETLCELSYEFAQKEDISFVQFDESIPYSEAARRNLVLTRHLPEKDILPSY